MKVILLHTFLLIFSVFIKKLEAAAIICDEKHEEIRANQTEVVNKGVKKLLHSIQCTLEKAKPWVDELEQEAKRLEVAAKRLGLGILHTFGEFMEKLVGDIQDTVITTNNKTTTTTTTTTVDESDTKLSETSEITTVATTKTTTTTVATTSDKISTSAPTPTVTTAPDRLEDNENEIFNLYESNEVLCPDGFKADHKGICERIN